MFGRRTLFGGPDTFAGPSTQRTPNPNPNNDFVVTSPPDDSVSCMEFSPLTISTNYLVAGSWDNIIRCWEVEPVTGHAEPKSMQSMQGPILDVCWSDDGTKVFMASCDMTVNCWDLTSGQQVQVAQHEATVKTCHWIKAPNYACLMTSSWDKTIKFWDTRSSTPMLSIALPERSYCADVEYPMAVVATANRRIITYQLENTPSEYKNEESSLKHQHRTIAIFRDRQTNAPKGCAMGSVEGRIAIHNVHNVVNPKENFTFKCHRSTPTNTAEPQDIFAVHDIKFHPVHGTFASVGSDGRYNFWDKNSRSKLKTSEQMELPITSCAFNSNGHIFAYAVNYDWSKGHAYNNPAKKPAIYLHHCFEDLKPKSAI